MSKAIAIFLLCSIIWKADAKTPYKVPSLDSKSLPHTIKSIDNVFVKFYAPWCGHCQDMDPSWKKLGAKYLKAKGIRIVKVNCDKHQKLCAKHGVQGYPTLKLYQNGDFKKPINFRGSRNFNSFEKFIIKHVDPSALATDEVDKVAPQLNEVQKSVTVGLCSLLAKFIGLLAIFGICVYGWPARIYKAPTLYSTTVPASAKGENGEIHQSVYYAGDKLAELSLESLYSNFLRGVSISKHQHCMGCRPIRSDGTAGQFVWRTYQEIQQLIVQFGAGLAHLSMLSKLDTMKVIGIYLENCPEWVIAEHGTYAFNGTTVPLHISHDTASLEYIINQAKLTTIVCTAAELEKLTMIKPHCKYLANVIIVGKRNDDQEIEAGGLGVKIYAFEDIIKTGGLHPREPSPPKASDIATLNYSRDIVGELKGLMLSHKAILANAVAIPFIVGTDIFNQETTHLSYLPLSHAFERMIQVLVWGAGGKIGFSQGDSLKLFDDVRVLQPTVFCSVPQLLDRLHSKIIKRSQQSKLKTWIFNTALQAKIANLKGGYLEHPFWDSLIFRKIRFKLGLDRCKMIFTGSAPINSQVLDFVRVCLISPVIQGYGQDECSFVATLTHPHDFSTGTVGGPLPSCTIKLVSVPEMDFLITDSSHETMSCAGRGEICFRGPSLFEGYYDQGQRMQPNMDADGWLHSGDIGLWTIDGKLKVIGRKNNMFKISQGEDISPDKIENILCTSSFIAQAFVYGDCSHPYIVAIIVPDEKYVNEWQMVEREPPSIGCLNLKTLCTSERLHSAIMDDIYRVSTAAKLKNFEIPQRIYLSPFVLSVTNGILTPDNKLRRCAARNAFHDAIGKMFQNDSDLTCTKSLKRE